MRGIANHSQSAHWLPVNGQVHGAHSPLAAELACECMCLASASGRNGTAASWWTLLLAVAGIHRSPPLTARPRADAEWPAF